MTENEVFSGEFDRERHPHQEPEKCLSRPDLTVIVVNYNTSHLLDRMFSALRLASENICVQIVVVDNASRDDSVAVLREKYPDVTLICSANNIGFGRANNLAVPHIRSDFVLLLNTDAFVAQNSLKSCLAYMSENPDIGVLGVRLVGSDGMEQPSCRYFPTPFNTFLQGSGIARYFPSVRLVDSAGSAPAVAQDCDWVPGCFYLTRRNVIEECGLFDPRYFLYYEEVDHCQAVKLKGWRVAYFPGTEVIHLGGESAKTVGALTTSGNQLSHLQMESEIIYFRKHMGFSGVVIHMLLSGMLSMINILKACARGTFRRGGWTGVSREITAQHLRVVTLFATHFGLKPIR